MNLFYLDMHMLALSEYMRTLNTLYCIERVEKKLYRGQQSLLFNTKKKLQANKNQKLEIKS